MGTWTGDSGTLSLNPPQPQISRNLPTRVGRPTDRQCQFGASVHAGERSAKHYIMHSFSLRVKTSQAQERVTWIFFFFCILESMICSHHMSCFTWIKQNRKVNVKQTRQKNNKEWYNMSKSITILSDQLHMEGGKQKITDFLLTSAFSLLTCLL